jgi:hypothetical protein
MKILRDKMLPNHLQRNVTKNGLFQSSLHLTKYYLWVAILFPSTGIHFSTLSALVRGRFIPHGTHYCSFNPQGGKRDGSKCYHEVAISDTDNRQTHVNTRHMDMMAQYSVVLMGRSIQVTQVRKQSHELNQRLPVTHCSNISTAFTVLCPP